MLTLEWTMEVKSILLSLIKNPITYWLIFISFLVTKRRMAREIIQFDNYIIERFAEWKKTLLFSALFSLLISFITLSLGLVITYEVVLILCIIVFLFSYVYNFVFLSASFTLAFTYFLLYKSILNHYEDGMVILTSITLLIGLFLIAEAFLLYKVKNTDTFPELASTKRGTTFGQLHINKISFIPILIFVPNGTFTALFPIFPVVTVDGSSAYSIVAVPFFVGFHYLAQKRLPEQVAKRTAKRTAGLGIVIMVLSIFAYNAPNLSVGIALIALLGRAFIHVFADEWRVKSPVLFSSISPGVKVLWIIENSYAEHAGLNIGDTILRINEVEVSDVNDFYTQLHEARVMYTLDIRDANHQTKTMEAMLMSPHKGTLGLILL